MSNFIDIRAVKLKEAGDVLAPVLAEIYIKHGLDLTTTLLMYYAAKGIMLSYNLTSDEKMNKLRVAADDFIKAIKVINKSLDNDIKPS